MANTYTSHYNFIKPEIGADSDAWGGHVNADLDAIDNELWNRVRSDVPQTLTQPLSLNAQGGQDAGQAATVPWVVASINAYDAAAKRYVDNRIAWFMDNYVLPIGTVIAWAGTLASIPYGWALCNGQVLGAVATPNLSDRFIFGAGANAPGVYGGQSMATLGAHVHGAQEIAAGPAGNPTGTFYNGSANVQPPYYVLAWIMRYIRMQDTWVP